MASSELIERCREMRKNPTKAEALLWEHLRKKQVKGLKIRRQHPICGFIIDFYCVEARLGIELDGSVHNKQEQSDYDDARTLELSDYDVKILRFWNSEVFKHVDKVVDRICVEIDLRIMNSINS
jgi:very-short-patch-repair endonuclease